MSCSSCTPWASTPATPRRWSRTRPRSSPATPWTGASTFNAVYDPSKHTTGAVTVLGFSSPNSSSDGQSVTQAYLSYLAHHPSTAKRLATQVRDVLRRRLALGQPGQHPGRRLHELWAPASRPCSWPWRHTRSSSPPRATRCAPRSATWWRRPASSRSTSRRPRPAPRGPPRRTTSPAPTGSSRGHDRTASRSTTRPGRRPRGCSTATACTATPPAASTRTRRTTSSARPGCRRRRCASTPTSSTCAAPGSGAPRPHASSRPPRRRSASPARP